MPNIGALLKEEIVRLSRRENRKQTAALQKASAAYRHEFAAMKRRLAALERAVAQAQKNVRAAPAERSESAAASMRFVAKGFKSMRARLGLSAAQIGKLLGVSEQSVYNWESKKAVPRRSQLPAIAQLRGLGKREAMSRLESAPKKKAKR